MITPSVALVRANRELELIVNAQVQAFRINFNSVIAQLGTAKLVILLNVKPANLTIQTVRHVEELTGYLGAVSVPAWATSMDLSPVCQSPMTANPATQKNV